MKETRAAVRGQCRGLSSGVSLTVTHFLLLYMQGADSAFSTLRQGFCV